MAAEDEKKITLARLESIPSYMKLSIGSYGSMGKWELIEHVKENDAVGELVTEFIMTNLKSFKDK